MAAFLQDLWLLQTYATDHNRLIIVRPMAVRVVKPPYAMLATLAGQFAQLLQLASAENEPHPMTEEEIDETITRMQVELEQLRAPLKERAREKKEKE